MSCHIFISLVLSFVGNKDNSHSVLRSQAPSHAFFCEKIKKESSKQKKSSNQAEVAPVSQQKFVCASGLVINPTGLLTFARGGPGRRPSSQLSWLTFSDFDLRLPFLVTKP
jgi:hypothetical protein